MGPVAGRWLLVVCCAFAVASAAQDNVLRFLSHKETVRMKQQKQSDFSVFSSGYQGDKPMEKFRAQATVCPNGITQCPDSSTCCPLQNGEYGCCEGVNAVCCKDGVHCCPQGYKCDMQHSQCTSDALGISFHWVDKKVVRAQPVARVGASNITCRDNKTKCQANDTCCPAIGGFGCCPLRLGVCCSDRLHCCPQGTKCDVKRKHCYREGGQWEQPWIERHQPKPDSGSERSQAPSKPLTKKGAVICKDGWMCPDGDTCCLLESGSYGCCPFSDKDQASLSDSVTSVVCPGGQYQCPDGSTCCQLSSGQWACCPLPQAVCCPDHIHCCPSGTACDATTGSCNRNQVALPWSTKKPAVPREKVKSVECPDGSQCRDGDTCCPLGGGKYGCCPYQQAVCCSDKLHCCPHGYICNLTTKYCDKGTTSIPWVEKRPAVSSVQAVVCPDGKSECPDGNTCCKLTSGAYGCCPLPKAVCCSDGVHCCPSGYTCDPTRQSCSKGNDFVPWEEKMPARQREESVTCPDQSECPDGNTCCKLSSGQYGCCPLPNAVCCSDGVHCCPSGYTCDPAHQSCSKGNDFVPWEEKKPARQRMQSVICPDHQSECPDGSTCCKLSSGQYGCCPLPNAVCCSDGSHCCPSGYTCDPAHQSCSKGNDFVPWEEKMPARQRAQSVICPDGQSECPDGTTCCKLSTGQYGCCPLPEAVCCSDGIHCCPSGSTCDLVEQRCQKGQDSVPFVKKVPALQSHP